MTAKAAPTGPVRDLSGDARARRAEWFAYYSPKRVGHQHFQVKLLEGLEVGSVLEIGPGFGLVTAMLDNAGYRVTTFDMFPTQYPHPRVAHVEGDLRDVPAERLGGFDAMICCETLEHFPWPEVDGLLAKLRQAAPRYLVMSVPYMGFQVEWRLYVNRLALRHALSMKALRWLKPFTPDTDPLGHKWEVGYRGNGLRALEAKVTGAGWRIRRRDFTSPTRSVFYVLEPAGR